MTIHQLYELIDLQPEMVQKLERTARGICLDPLSPCLDRMTEPSTVCQAYETLEALLQDDEEHIKMLYCQLECARRIYDKYRKMQISQTIYADTMKCFPRFVEECRKKTGRIFFDRSWWTYRQISMSLFRLGALEYEFRPEEERAIAVHIPSDADLSRTAVAASMKEAHAFFRTFYPDYPYDKFTCDSWLMAPVLKTLLPESSNILAFQSLFEITGERTDSSGCLEWLFQSPGCKNYEDLPAGTSLQKKAKELLLKGGHVGNAHGEIRF